jgi:phosphoenolpyruvate carboxylase
MTERSYGEEEMERKYYALQDRVEELEEELAVSRRETEELRAEFFDVVLSELDARRRLERARDVIAELQMAARQDEA